MFRQFLRCSFFLQLLVIQKITLSHSKQEENQGKENNIDKHLQEQSNIISEQEKDINSIDELEHYHVFQKQTIYDGVDDLVTSKVISTSPPKLTIQPSAVDQSTELTMTLNSYTSKVKVVVSSPLKEEACETETHLLDIHPSKSLQSSISGHYEVSVLAGREQMPSKTESLSDFYQPASFVSQPSKRLVLKTCK